jgi:hypothetical protein
MSELSAWAAESPPQCSLPGADIKWGETLPDWCEPLDSPVWVEPGSADLMLEDDPVVGFEAGGRMWAIPWWVMKNHHVANLTLEGKPVLVTLCEVCVAGGVFDPVIDDRRFHFRCTGWYREAPLMMDDATGSYWSLPNGVPFEGPAASIGRLPMRPIVHATWQQWSGTYPETLVVHGEGEPRDGHGSIAPSPDHQHFAGQGTADPRLPASDLVVGLERAGRRRAYPLAAVHAAGGVIDDVLGGTPIVVTAMPGSWVTVSFERELEGISVSLRWEDVAAQSPHLVDESSGSRFDLWGRCVGGPLEGLTLAYIPSALRKWLAWVVESPDYDLWQQAGS